MKAINRRRRFSKRAELLVSALGAALITTALLIPAVWSGALIAAVAPRDDGHAMQFVLQLGIASGAFWAMLDGWSDCRRLARRRLLSVALAGFMVPGWWILLEQRILAPRAVELVVQITIYVLALAGATALGRAGERAAPAGVLGASVAALVLHWYAAIATARPWQAAFVAVGCALPIVMAAHWRRLPLDRHRLHRSGRRSVLTVAAPVGVLAAVVLARPLPRSSGLPEAWLLPWAIVVSGIVVVSSRAALRRKRRPRDLGAHALTQPFVVGKVDVAAGASCAFVTREVERSCLDRAQLVADGAEQFADSDDVLTLVARARVQPGATVQMRFLLVDGRLFALGFARSDLPENGHARRAVRVLRADGTPVALLRHEPLAGPRWWLAALWPRMAPTREQVTVGRRRVRVGSMVLRRIRRAGPVRLSRRETVVSFELAVRLLIDAAAGPLPPPQAPASPSRLRCAARRVLGFATLSGKLDRSRIRCRGDVAVAAAVLATCVWLDVGTAGLALAMPWIARLTAWPVDIARRMRRRATWEARTHGPARLEDTLWIPWGVLALGTAVGAALVSVLPPLVGGNAAQAVGPLATAAVGALVAVAVAAELSSLLRAAATRVRADHAYLERVREATAVPGVLRAEVRLWWGPEGRRHAAVGLECDDAADEAAVAHACRERLAALAPHALLLHRLRR